MNYPESFDTAESTFASPSELVVLTLASDLLQGGTEATFNETAIADALEAPGYLTWRKEVVGAFEIVKFTGHGDPGELTGLQRGALGTTDMDHLAADVDDQAVMDPVSEHWAVLRAMLEALQRYRGLVGLKEDLPASCEPGQVYIATDTEEIFQGVAEDEWRLINRFSHDDYGALDQDDHPQYQTEARKEAWHTALAGSHMSDPENHDHSGGEDMGAPAAGVRHGLLEDLPALPEDDIEVYFATDTSDLFFANDDLSGWDRYSVMPTGTIILFEGACPPGWAAYEAMEGFFPRGADADQWENFVDGGSAEHEHVLPHVIAHTHDVDAVAVSTDTGGNHNHSFTVKGGGSTAELAYDGSYTTWVNMTAEHGSHSHTATIPAHNTQNHGGSPATSEPADSLPPYRKYVFCERQ